MPTASVYDDAVGRIAWSGALDVQRAADPAVRCRAPADSASPRPVLRVIDRATSTPSAPGRPVGP